MVYAKEADDFLSYTSQVESTNSIDFLLAYLIISYIQLAIIVATNVTYCVIQLYNIIIIIMYATNS